VERWEIWTSGFW